MPTLTQDMRSTFAAQLQGRTATTASRWAQRYRMMVNPFPGLYDFKYHPWCREIHDCNDNEIVLRKGAQVGLSETLINIALFNLDKKRLNVSYFLPTTTPDAENFSRTRIGLAIDSSPYIRAMFTGSDQSGIKQTSTNTLYIRGAKVSRQLKTIDTAVTICDEADEFPHFAIPMIRKRMAGQLTHNKKLIGCSTPSVNGSGIDNWFQESTQEYFWFKCPHCSRFTTFKFPESLIITAESPSDPKIKDSHYICFECKHILDQEAKPEFLRNAEWVASHANSLIRGFQIDEMFSYTVQPWEMAQDYLRSLNDPYSEQEFYNSNLGLPHVVGNSMLSDSIIAACNGNYTMESLLRADGIRTMGIDVGKELHLVVKLWHLPNGLTSPELNEDAHSRYLAIQTVKEFDDLDPIIARLRPNIIVIDANPEHRLSKRFCMKYQDLAYMCWYGRDAAERKVNLKTDGLSVSAHRTSWLDQTLSRYHNRTTSIPVDAPTEFRIHLKNVVRSYKLDREKTRESAEYKKLGPDHYTHADNYAEIALNLVSQLGISGNI
jgi:hypothetical protein